MPEDHRRQATVTFRPMCIVPNRVLCRLPAYVVGHTAAFHAGRNLELEGLLTDIQGTVVAGNSCSQDRYVSSGCPQLLGVLVET